MGALFFNEAIKGVRSSVPVVPNLTISLKYARKYTARNASDDMSFTSVLFLTLESVTAKIKLKSADIARAVNGTINAWSKNSRIVAKDMFMNINAIMKLGKNTTSSKTVLYISRDVILLAIMYAFGIGIEMSMELSRLTNRRVYVANTLPMIHSSSSSRIVVQK